MIGICRNLFKSFKNLKIKNKFLLSNIPLIIIPIIVITVLSYKKSTYILEQQTIQSTKHSFEQANRFISYKLDKIKDISSMLYINKDLQRILGKVDNYAIKEQIDDHNELLDIIATAENNKEVYDVRIYVTNDSLYSRQSSQFFRVNEVADKEWFKKVVDQRGAMYWQSTYSYDYMDSKGSQNIVSCIRTINSEGYTGRMVGAVSIDILEDTFYQIIKQANISNTGDILLVDNEGNIISTHDKSKIGTNIMNLPHYQQTKGSDEGYKKMLVDDKMSIVYYKKIESTDWQLIAFIPLEEILAPNKQISNYMTILLILTTLIAAASATLISYGITKRIRLLIRSMEKIEQEKWDILITVDSEDEIGILQRKFNKMVENIQTLIREKYQVEVYKKNAELKALQAQINPHFLYNTLDMINWMSMKYKAMDISMIVGELARFFRLSLSEGREAIPIRDELEHVLTYINIQNKRFNKSIETILEVDEDIMEFITVKLVLQPIVENSILHGIQEKYDKQGYIKITGFRNGNIIRMSVEDNGVGMDKTALDLIIGGTQSKGYGIKNVNERIKTYFGEEYGLKYESEVGKGTKVYITFPVATISKQ